MRAKPHQRKSAGLWALTATLAFVALSGCIGGAQATSSLYVKDALTDEVDAVHVTFTKAQAKPVEGSWMNVFEGKETIELLSLSAPDAKEKLAGFDLPPGEYEGLRIAVSEVEITHLDGSKELLNVYGNVVSVSDDFTVGSDGIDILVDFDLDAGVDLEAGTYTPVVKTVQTSDDDSDGDGENDVDDVDDDNDGETDDKDDDRDGDGEDDEPRQHHGNITTICAAERDEELAQAQQDLDEELAEAEADFDEEVAEAAADRDAKLANASTDAERDEAWADYNETVDDAQRDLDESTVDAREEYDESVEEAREEHSDCLDDADEFDDDESDEDESDAEESDEDEREDDLDEDDS